MNAHCAQKSYYIFQVVECILQPGQLGFSKEMLYAKSYDLNLLVVSTLVVVKSLDKILLSISIT